MIRQIFYAVLNILGLDYSHRIFPLKFIIRLRIFLLIIQLLIHAKMIKNSLENKNNYFYFDVFQNFMPWILELSFVIRAYNFEKNGEKIEIEIFNHKYLIIGIVTNISMKLLQSSILRSRILGKIQYFTIGISGFTISCNDFLFAAYVDSLSDKLKFDSNLNEFIKTFKLKRKLVKRYSFEIFCNVTYNFGVMIYSFYWIFMRITYGFLSQFIGEIFCNYFKKN